MPPRRRAPSDPHHDDSETPCKLCEITPAAGGKVLFLKSPASFACPYKVAFGNGQVCTNPARRKIYEEQGV